MFRVSKSAVTIRGPFLVTNLLTFSIMDWNGFFTLAPYEYSEAIGAQNDYRVDE